MLLQRTTYKGNIEIFASFLDHLAQESTGTERTGIVGILIEQVAHDHGRFLGIGQNPETVEIWLNGQYIASIHARPSNHKIGVIGESGIADGGNGDLVLQANANIGC